MRLVLMLLNAHLLAYDILHADNTSTTSDSSVSFYAVAPFANAEFGFSLSAVSDTSIWYTTNKGLFRYNGNVVNKILDISLFTRGLIEIFQVQALADNDVWVMGHDAQTWEKTMYHFDGKRWTKVVFPQYSTDPTDDLVLHRFRMMHTNGTTFGCGVGQDGLLYFFDGSQWKLGNPFTPHTLRALFINSPNDIWAGGREGNIYHYNGAGWTRTPVKDSVAGDYIMDMSFVSPSYGWAVGMKSILHYNGTTWRAFPVPISGVPRCVMMRSPSDGWILIDDGSVLRYDGSMWKLGAKLPMQVGLTSMVATFQQQSYRLYTMSSTGIITNAWGKLPTLIDVSAQSNIHLYGGAPTSGDFDNNGSLDLFVTATQKFPDRIYSNRGDGFFTEMTERLHPLEDIVAVGSAFADIDNNGYIDILPRPTSNQEVWYPNKGSWKFSRAPHPINYAETTDRSLLQCADMDNDGDLDIVLLHVIPSESDRSFTVYYNDGVGRTWQPVRLLHKSLSGALTMSYFVADLNNDGFTDIFKYNIGEPCELYINENGRSFTEAASLRGLDGISNNRTPYITSASPIDINHDGALDVFMIFHEGKAVFFMNDGNGVFTRGDSIVFDAQGENPAGLFVDIDCDGDQDLYLLDRFYENHNGKFSTYRKIGFQKKCVPHFADIDNDGDPDMLLSAYNEENRIYVYENGLNPTNVATITLRGIRSNSHGIGVKLSLWKNHSDGTRTLAEYFQIDQSTPIRLPLDRTEIYDLEVLFPSGIKVIKEHFTAGLHQIAEFQLVQGVLWDFLYSFRRSILFSNILLEVGKLLLVLVIVVIGIRFTVSTTKNQTRLHILFSLITVALYILAVHATIRNGLVEAAIYPLTGTILLTGGWVFFQRRAETRRRARFISHYELQGLLGEGGMGKVYQAIDIQTKSLVAVKVLAPSLMDNVENRKRLMAEGHLLSSLNHPHILKVMEVGEHLGQGFIAMEYLPGGTLKQRLDNEFPLPMNELKRLVLQICGGLEEIHHHGIIHRDLKTGNVMLDGNGNVRIMDFGLSKSPLVTTMTTLGTVIGTLGYVAPEQVTGMNVDQRVDIFSFGVILYELLTKQLPFTGENEIAVIHSIFNTQPPAPSTLQPNVPTQLDAIVMQCLAKEPAQRFNTAVELRLALEKNFW